MTRIPVSFPWIDEEEKAFVAAALDKSEISGTFGGFLPRFEKGFADYCGVKHGIAVANGTVALHVALAALGIGAGDEVLVQTFTNMASAFAVLYTGAKPVAVDIEPDTWNLNPALLEAKITPRTKAIMVVHIYGHPVDMDPVLAIAKKHNLYVIEDAAESHGAEYKGKKTGSLSDIACFSFYANKILTTGEGGMILTNSDELAAKVRMLSTLAYGPAEERFMHRAIGFNYRMPNTIAALGVAQLNKIENTVELKRIIAAAYNAELAGIPELQLPVEKEYAKNVYWMYHVVLRGKAAGCRKEIMQKLSEQGIETREAFTPINRQRIFVEQGLTREDECPVANDIGANGFYLPSGPVMPDGTPLSADTVKIVADAIKKALA